MVMTSTAIRFAPEEKSWIQSYADFHGISFSEAVREAILEKIEDDADIKAFNEALVADDGTTYNMDEVDQLFDRL